MADSRRKALLRKKMNADYLAKKKGYESSLEKRRNVLPQSTVATPLSAKDKRRANQRAKMKKYYASDKYKNRKRTDFSKTAYDTATTQQKKIYNAKPKTQATFKISEPAKIGIKDVFSGTQNAKGNATQFDVAYRNGGIKNVQKKNPKYDVRATNKQLAQNSLNTYNQYSNAPTRGKDETNEQYQTRLASFYKSATEAMKQTESQNLGIARAEKTGEQKIEKITPEPQKKEKEFLEDFKVPDFTKTDTYNNLSEKQKKSEDRIKAKFDRKEKEKKEEIARATEELKGKQKASAEAMALQGHSQAFIAGIQNQDLKALDDLRRRGEISLADLEEARDDALLNADEVFSDALNDYVKTERKAYNTRIDNERKAVLAQKKEKREVWKFNKEKADYEVAKKEKAMKILSSPELEVAMKYDMNIVGGTWAEYFSELGVDFDMKKFIEAKTKEDLLDVFLSDAKYGTALAKEDEAVRLYMINHTVDLQKKIELQALNEAIKKDEENKRTQALEKKQKEANIRTSEYNTKHSKTSTGQDIGEVPYLVTKAIDESWTDGTFFEAVKQYPQDERANMIETRYKMLEAKNQTPQEDYKSDPNYSEKYGYGYTPVPKGGHGTRETPDTGTKTALDNLNKKVKKKEKVTEKGATDFFKSL